MTADRTGKASNSDDKGPDIRGDDGSPPLPPQELRFMQETDERYREVGDDAVADLRKTANLSTASFVVDIGCGYGRLAHALLRWPDFKGRYFGFDILPRHIAWCQESLTPIAPERFRFEVLDIKNDRYNPKGRIRPSEVRFPVEDGVADTIVLLSVFTHMFPKDVEHYLTEIRRILSGSGTVLATFFLMDEEWKGLARQGKTQYELPHRLTRFCRFMTKDDPLHVIAYKDAWVRKQLQRNGLGLLAPISHGTWRGTGSAPNFQDQLIFGPID